MKKLLFTIYFLCLCSVVVAQHKYHDAAMFNAPNEKVKSIKYATGMINFSEEGKLIKDESSYLKMYSKYDILRDSNGYPIELITDFDTTKFVYDDEKRISKRIVSAGNSTVIFAYEYFGSDVTITRVESVAGQPKNTVTKYDMNEFDVFGNWVQKGIKGTKRTEATVKTDYTLGNATNQYAVNTWTTTEYKDYYEGQEKEIRKITYGYDGVYTRGDSTDEISIVSAVKDYFFLGVGDSFKEVEKYIKKNKVECEQEIDSYGYHLLTIPKSDKLYYGNPIINMLFSHTGRSGKIYGEYSFIIELKDLSQKDDFLKFIADTLDVDITKGRKGLEVCLRIDSDSKVIISTRAENGLLVQRVPSWQSRY